ncbi:MAG: ribonuclease M5 [Bacilli bacterium]
MVEGKSDKAFLSSFIDAEFVETNGSDVPAATIEYLKAQSKKRDIIVLVDPDAPGLKIRAKLDENIPGLRHCFVNKKDAIKNGKVGVAETTKSAVLQALNFQVENKAVQTSDLQVIDLYKLGLMGSKNANDLRSEVADYFHLGFVNGKQFLKRAKSLNISYQVIEEAIREIR